MVDLQKIIKDSGLSKAFFPSVVYPMPIKDNTIFAQTFDKSALKGVVAKPTKALIVDQDPEPGEIVPAGTRINVILTVKDVIPVESFKEINEAVVNRYSSVGALENDLEKEDTVSQEAKAVLDRDKDYNSLSSLDKQAVDRFMNERFGEQVEDIKKKIYSNIKFLHHL